MRAFHRSAILAIIYAELASSYRAIHGTRPWRNSSHATAHLVKNDSYGPPLLSKDGKCGNGVSCLGSVWGNCCSKFGYCGSSLTYCGGGCQSDFGFCESTEGTISPDGTCGGDDGFTCIGNPIGSCCSSFGFCGSTGAYCGDGCKQEFGNCTGTSPKWPNSTTTRLPSATTSSAPSSRLTSPSSSTPISSLAPMPTPSSTCATVPPYQNKTSCVPCEGQNPGEPHCGGTIDTNYYEFVPITCKTVYYTLDIMNGTVSPDGVERIGFMVNGQSPGPTIEADWGDTVVVTVNNRLTNNGTSIHFHGIRQNQTNQWDGVTSITQCPIAPGHSMTYSWRAMSYGVSWYHSHFNIQAYEGVFGPIVIRGPTTKAYDVDAGTVMLGDWPHKTMYTLYDIAQDVKTGGPQIMDNGLINGMNTWGADGTNNQTGQRFELETKFVQNKTYMLGIINAGIQSSYKFYIDGHKLTVIASDFTPVVPYETDYLSINNGQRYVVLVTANQPVGDYWMRADNQNACFFTRQATDIKGIVRYQGSPGNMPASKKYNYTNGCVDEPMDKLIPHMAVNVDTNGQTLSSNVDIKPNPQNLFRWYFGTRTFQANYSDPTLYHWLEHDAAPSEDKNIILDVPTKQWIYLIMETTIPMPHPVHLHGHDFFVLAEGDGAYTNYTLNLQNPPRRDTAMMPSNGHLVIAFETDNPGVWLMHCHIGWHASMGFALQILERKNEIRDLVSDQDTCGMRETCEAWYKYTSTDPVGIQDSGV